MLPPALALRIGTPERKPSLASLTAGRRFAATLAVAVRTRPGDEAQTAVAVTTWLTYELLTSESAPAPLTVRRAVSSTAKDSSELSTPGNCVKAFAKELPSLSVIDTVADIEAPTAPARYVEE